jgi:hypothetical protein
MPKTSGFRTTLIRRTVLGLLSLALLSAVPFAFADDWKYEETHRDAREFVTGGYVHVRMSVGDLHIKRGDSTKIKLEYTVKSHREKNVKNATLEFEIKGNNATIEFHAPSGGNTQFDVELEVPQNTNIDVHEKVGDLTVDNIEGDKDLSLGVGDIRVTSGPTGYRVVNASSGIGDVHGADYGETSGWLGKTLKYHGDGKYELRAHVGVGDINLEGR